MQTTFLLSELLILKVLRDTFVKVVHTHTLQIPAGDLQKQPGVHFLWVYIKNDDGGTSVVSKTFGSQVGFTWSRKAANDE